MAIMQPHKVKPRKCKVCKTKFLPVYGTLQAVCSAGCAAKEARAIEEQQWKERKKSMKEKVKKLTDYEHEAREAFQAWIRWRDKDKPCISCGSEKSLIWDGGHYLKAELYSGLIFDPDNCHKQCRHDNWFLGGNETAYRDGLIKRYGEQFVRDLEAKKDSHRNHKYTKQELIDIRDHYRQLLNQIKKTA